MQKKRLSVENIDMVIEADPHMEPLMKPVAQVAARRLGSVAGLGDEAWNNAAMRIVLGARSGVLRVRGMAHPEGGRLVHEGRTLEEVGEPLRVDVGPLGGPEGLAVPDVFFVRSQASGRMPWDASGAGGSGGIGWAGSRLEAGAGERGSCYVTRVGMDSQGRVAAKEEWLDGPILWRYGHDEAGRLAQATRNGRLVERYTYDARARRATDWSALVRDGERTFRYADDDRLLEAGPMRMAYDARGALAERRDASGAVFRFEHDRGRVTTVHLPDGRRIDHVHDGEGCRVERRVDGRLHWEYEWLDPIRLAKVRDVERGVEVRFEYGKDGAVEPERTPRYMVVDRGSGTVVRRYALVCDQRGSLRGVRNAAGALVKLVEYDSFGNVVRDQGAGEGENMFVPLGFAGGLPDPDHDLVHFVNRDYDPETGRWTAKDPLGLAGGDSDLYGYCLDDPVNYVDPLGLLRKGIGSGKSSSRPSRLSGVTGRWAIGSGAVSPSAKVLSHKKQKRRQTGFLDWFLSGSQGDEIVPSRTLDPDSFIFRGDPDSLDDVRSEANRLGSICTSQQFLEDTIADAGVCDKANQMRGRLVERAQEKTGEAIEILYGHGVQDGLYHTILRSLYR